METSTPARDRAPSDLAQLRERVAELRAAVDDSSARFDAPQVIADLQRLLQAARARSDAQAQVRRILILTGIAECRRGEPVTARDLLLEGLAIDAGEPIDSDQLTRDHYFLASVASDLKSFQIAAEHYGKAAEFARTAPGFAISQRLGIREKHAFALHEGKRFAEAYEVNRALLIEGEQHFGADAPQLNTVLINTAQNLYALGRLADAEGYLQRALAMARAAHDIEREQDLLYQLAVLASEQGRPSAARDYLAERVKRLENGGPPKLHEAARRSLEHFDSHQVKVR
jgi:tetratricopeptide (TPR) repeat protein